MTTLIGGSKKARDTFTFLRDKIVSGEWPVDSRIPREPELMELIGVGKSTVREAVRSLANLGMLEAIPGVGTFVRSRTPGSSIISEFLDGHELSEVLVYRRSLEIEAAQAAAINRQQSHVDQLWEAVHSDEQFVAEGEAPSPTRVSPGSFHHILFEASGSKLLLDLYLGTMTVIRRAGNENLILAGAKPETLLLDHRAITEAIEDQDVRDAAHAMALHVDRDLVLWDETLTLEPQTERAATLIEAGYEPKPRISPGFTSSR